MSVRQCYFKPMQHVCFSLISYTLCLNVLKFPQYFGGSITAACRFKRSIEVVRIEKMKVSIHPRELALGAHDWKWLYNISMNNFPYYMYRLFITRRKETSFWRQRVIWNSVITSTKKGSGMSASTISAFTSAKWFYDTGIWIIITIGVARFLAPSSNTTVITRFVYDSVINSEKISAWFSPMHVWFFPEYMHTPSKVSLVPRESRFLHRTACYRLPNCCWFHLDLQYVLYA